MYIMCLMALDKSTPNPGERRNFIKHVHGDPPPPRFIMTCFFYHICSKRIHMAALPQAYILPNYKNNKKANKQQRYIKANSHIVCNQTTARNSISYLDPIRDAL